MSKSPDRSEKKAIGARHSQLSAATSNAELRQAGRSTIIEVIKHAAKTTQAVSISLSSETARRPATAVNVVTLESKTKTTREHTNYGTATSGEITNGAPGDTEPIPHDSLPVRDVEKKTIFVDRTQPYGIASHPLPSMFPRP